MTIRDLSADHAWIKYPAFYNAYPLRNEIAAAGADYGSKTPKSYGDIYIDDYYGRIFDTRSHSVTSKYGRSAKMNHYLSIRSLELIDELRVPYRRIPIFLTDNLAIIDRAIDEMCSSNSGYEILLRGQTKTYLIERSVEESIHFYGEDDLKEPSFLPSHMRNRFDPYFLKCMWQSQAAILLNDIGFELGGSLAKPDLDAYWNMVTQLRQSPAFILLSLGVAQHYGMPSVGLDLTDRLEVACWFATHTITIAASGQARTELIKFSSDQMPTIFVFRCPRDAVFDYKVTKPREIPDGRPDKQSAWFGHVGWGAASNQLGSYLMCGFRLTSDIANDLDNKLDEELFPSASQDLILKHFLTMRGLEKYEGEAKRALSGIYFMSD